MIQSKPVKSLESVEIKNNDIFLKIEFSLIFIEI